MPMFPTLILIGLCGGIAYLWHKATVCACEAARDEARDYWVKQIIRERKRTQLALEDHGICNDYDCPRCSVVR